MLWQIQRYQGLLTEACRALNANSQHKLNPIVQEALRATQEALGRAKAYCDSPGVGGIIDRATVETEGLADARAAVERLWQEVCKTTTPVVQAQGDDLMRVDGRTAVSTLRAALAKT